MRKNKGYTLVEMIIVLAIMAILSAVSFVSIGIINKARYNSAISSFENQLTSLWVISKAASQAKTQSTTASDNANDVYPLCLRLQKNSDDTYWLVLGHHGDTGFIEKNSNEQDAKQNGDVLEMPKILTINYKPSDSSQTASIGGVGGGAGSSATPVSLIEYNKSDGSVRYGAGEYEFVYKDRIVGTVVLDKTTGKYYIK